jgi:D-psicose/D-tagatose/L-ribulose 3-epimerase
LNDPRIESLDSKQEKEGEAMGLKYAVTNWIFGGEPLEKSVARLQKLGYDGVELAVWNPQETDSNQIKALVSDHGLVVSNLNVNWGWGERRDLSNPDKQVRQAAIEYLKSVIELTKELGAISTGTIPSAVGKPGPQASREDEWKWAVEAVAEGAKYAEQLGVFLALEAANRYEVYMLKTVDDSLRFARDVGSPAVRVLVDCYHANIEEPDLPLAFRKAGNLLINVHVADSNRQAIGKGHTDFKSIVRTLKENRYPYYLTLEALLEGADPTNISRGFAHNESALDADAKLSIDLLKLFESLV